MPNKQTLKNRAKELRFFQQRMLMVVMGILLLVCCLVGRLAYLQIYHRNLYTTLSTANQFALIPIDPSRGLIYDRNGVLLAENIPVFSLDVTPSKAGNLKQTILALQQLLPISTEDVNAFYRAYREKRSFEAIPLKIKLNPEEVAKFSVNRWRFPGVMINARLIRHYPLGSSFAHVVGFMGRINADELDEVDSTNYSATNYIGKTGIEKYFEDELHGKVGYQQVEIDASGREIRIIKRTPPIAGTNLTLTIDSGLTQATEAALGDEVGAVVVMQPNTGEILAQVSTPSFDPNLFVQGISEDNYKSLQSAENHPLYDRTVRGLYSPGSTIKPFYGLAGLQAGTVNPQTSFFDSGSFKYANHVYHNWERNGFGWVNLEKSIMMSDDIYFYNLAVNLGVQKLDDTLTSFGFGQVTNVEQVDELPGTVPTPLWKRSHMGKPWYTGDTINMGIGQGFLQTTPLQMAAAIATIANRGTHYQPHLVLNLQPVPSSTVDIPAADWDLIIKAMQEVITSKEGTGFRFGHNPPYTVAAKTGTAQVYRVSKASHNHQELLPKNLRDNSLFIAFAPVDQPKIAIAIVVEHSEAAAAVARKVIDYYLQKTQPTLLTQKDTHAN